MGMARYQLIYKEKATRGPVIKQLCDGETPLEVRELTTQEIVRLKPSDISLYRHVLVIDNKPYDILNVLKLH